ncbi:MAG: Quercetin 2,3-dioxygenase [Ignavibacteria bacterium]|nr:Quercetin 2,3-dioxygenase [Ignavibacteria bacterium]
MTTTIHKADSRGYADHGWLKARHSFSFANYYNPKRIRFGLLRVLNDDIIEAGMGFGTHPHDNMEIVTIPLRGEIAHKDSTGNHGVIRAGDIQIMSAGSGLTHSEFNNSDKNDLNLLQIWVFPKEKDIAPRYDQKTFDSLERINQIVTLVSPDRSENTLWINQNAFFSMTDLRKDNSVEYKIIQKGNGVYVFLIEGEANVSGNILIKRDAIGIEDTDSIELTAINDSKILIIEVPMR